MAETARLGRPSTLTDRENLALNIAVGAGRRRRTMPGWVETTVLDEGWPSVTSFWADVNRLIDDPRAVASSPITCRHLAAIRDQRNVQRGH